MAAHRALFVYSVPYRHNFQVSYLGFSLPKGGTLYQGSLSFVLMRRKILADLTKAYHSCMKSPISSLSVLSLSRIHFIFHNILNNGRDFFFKLIFFYAVKVI
jgi:hypothetical protein